MTNTRTLRSKDLKEEPDTSNLFDFSFINPFIQQSKPIKISSRASDANIYHYSDDSIIPPKSSTQKPMNITRSNSIESPRKSRLREDPLNDSIYEPFHKQMWRQESRMASNDRLKLMSDVDTLINQKTQLGLYNWDKALLNITKINDVNDIDELEQKRDLTLKEIERRLMKYQNWKKRLENFKEQKKFLEKSLSIVDTSDEYNLPLETLRQRRKSEGAAHLNRPIKLILNNGYYLYIDPKTSPKILKSDSVNKKYGPKQNSKKDSEAPKSIRKLDTSSKTKLKHKEEVKSAAENIVGPIRRARIKPKGNLNKYTSRTQPKSTRRAKAQEYKKREPKTVKLKSKSKSTKIPIPNNRTKRITRSVQPNIVDALKKNQTHVSM